MLAVVPIAMEILGYLPTAIQLGVDITSTAQRAYALWTKGDATTPEELAALKADMEAEKQKLADMTAELDKDPT